jgi:outer membrane lipoprotein-sorting protein
MNKEKRLSRYIDDLNAGKKSKEKGDILTETVRKIRVLREPEYPDEYYQSRLITSLREKQAVKQPVKQPVKQQRAGINLIKRTVIVTTIVAATAVLLFASLDLALPNKNTSIVYAMEQAMQEIKAYHGVIKVVETNELGETMTQSSRDVWANKEGNYYLTELEGTASGIITANNGQMKWQIRPEEKAVYLFATFPDHYRFTFELGDEIEEVMNALTVKIIGDDIIAGRKSSLLEITPDGGDTYHLWVDKETNLPLQRQSAMQNAIQYKVSFSSIEFEDAVPQEYLSYNLPSGYEEIDTDPEQVINTIEEAESIVGFQPYLPKDIPEGYAIKRIAIQKKESTIKYYYTSKDGSSTVVILQSLAKKEFSPIANAILGTVNNNVAEILTEANAFAIRWQELGMEYSIVGNISLEELSLFAEGLSEGEVQIPTGEDRVLDKPQVEVPVDLVAEENDQKSVDAGHSPWKLDPAFVTQVFASLLISPEGIVGDYPIAYEDIQITHNNGTDAVAEIKGENSIARYVYLRRFIRQDNTGIWTVIGYDTTE